MAQHLPAAHRQSNYHTPTLFVQTRDECLEVLTSDEQARLSKCASMEDLLADLKAMEGFSKSRRRMTASLTKVKAYGDNLEPYFKIMEILCATNPEWANIALGAFRLILQLSSNFIGFF
ncbi:hypothetical protein B0H63DRAFT_468028, partial [Podospora didyma]